MHRVTHPGLAAALPPVTRPASLACFTTAGVLVGILLLFGSARLPGQTVRLGAEAVGVFHASERSPGGTGRSAWQIIHPLLTARVAWPSGLGLRATVNLEGLTLPEGELAMGAWGEGFVDRRHPHAYVHELLVEAATTFECGGLTCRAGGYLGRGFAPFGSDDPMQRAPLRYPVNHHLAQILERAILGAQFGIGPLTAEAAVFNGDEPEAPSQWPRIRGRFGDSWSVRATLRPLDGVEVSASTAAVRSPEHRPGAGADHDKLHLGARLEQALGGGHLTVLGEWARTSELEAAFLYYSRLGELSWSHGRFRIHYRGERTDRPEEERLEPYRTARPHLENTLLGKTRWTLHTVGAELAIPPRGALAASVVLEATRGAIASAAPGSIFSIEHTYGGNRFWSAAVAVRVGWSATGHDMGRYGIVPARPIRH